MTGIVEDCQMMWAVKTHLPAIAEIDRLAYGSAMTDEDFRTQIRQRDIVAKVMLDDKNEVIAFIIYAVRQKRRIIERLAVRPAWRRQGCASRLVQDVLQKLSQGWLAVMNVDETDAAAIGLARANGFLATAIERRDGECDQYVFEHLAVITTR